MALRPSESWWTIGRPNIHVTISKFRGGCVKLPDGVFVVLRDLSGRDLVALGLQS
jgi:hypothetical protein